MALTACVLGMFVITLDAVVVNVALPSISRDLGGGITGLQWVADGYTLMFAALLLSGGAFSDRIGARNAFALGVAGFVVASALCGAAPNLTTLIAARFLQGIFAAVVTPSSIALLGQTFPAPRARARAVGIWAMGGAVASTAGPVLGAPSPPSTGDGSSSSTCPSGSSPWRCWPAPQSPAVGRRRWTGSARSPRCWPWAA